MINDQEDGVKKTLMKMFVLFFYIIEFMEQMLEFMYLPTLCTYKKHNANVCHNNYDLLMIS